MVNLGEGGRFTVPVNQIYDEVRGVWIDDLDLNLFLMNLEMVWTSNLDVQRLTHPDPMSRRR